MKEKPITKEEVLENRFNKRRTTSGVDTMLPSLTSFDDMLDKCTKAIRIASKDDLSTVEVKHQIKDKDCRDKCFDLLLQYFRSRDIYCDRFFLDQHDDKKDKTKITGVIDNTIQFRW